MTIQQFINARQIEIKNLIDDKLGETFDSHQFIETFAKEFENDYINFLEQYSDNHHRTVHSQIANALRKNMELFKVQTNGKANSKSVFGNDVPNEEWVKLK